MTELSIPRTHPTMDISSHVGVVSEKGDHRSMSLTLVSTTAATEEDTVCVLTCTLAVASRWMSAPAWTSRCTTSVWPFSLATYTGL